MSNDPSRSPNHPLTPADVDRELHERLGKVSPARRELIRRAFGLLPALERLRTLDAGCGRGGPTIELASLTRGEIVGLDVDGRALRALAACARREELSDRVHPVRGSMSAMPFAPRSFDLVWAEASLHAIGFKTGLTAWRQLLAVHGCLVVHEMAWLRPDPPAALADHWRRFPGGLHTVADQLDAARWCGYEVLSHFEVPGEFWWMEYYTPLQDLIVEMRRRRPDTEAREILESQQREVDLHRAHGRWMGSAYFVLRPGAAGCG